MEFRSYSLYDQGAYPEPPLSGKLTWRIIQPWAEILEDKEREGQRRAREFMERLRTKAKKKQDDKPLERGRLITSG
ncbi:MAG: hypothetical protein ABSG35_00825 [Syntrophobacteraceae bacterium]